jgi:IS30 family transposase
MCAKGTNKNASGFIQEYLPKGTEIPGAHETRVGHSDELNDRPRARIRIREAMRSVHGA